MPLTPVASASPNWNFDSFQLNEIRENGKAILKELEKINIGITRMLEFQESQFYTNRIIVSAHRDLTARMNVQIGKTTNYEPIREDDGSNQHQNQHRHQPNNNKNKAPIETGSSSRREYQNKPPGCGEETNLKELPRRSRPRRHSV